MLWIHEASSTTYQVLEDNIILTLSRGGPADELTFSRLIKVLIDIS
jgi:hypothetical protein